jgi:DNA-binding MarR family transcriptional regulator
MTITQLKTARFYNIGLTALELLLTLAEREELPMTTLADDLGISTAGVTSTADSLAKKGMVRRAHSSIDRRSINLALTELGRARVFQITGRLPEAALHS